jgi:MOSC domain-containing protein YiiM
VAARRGKDHSVDALMKVVSLNTGLPRDVRVNGQTVRTSIWKSPREGRLRVTTLNIEGDQQSDLTVHGGRSKAVYCYPSEHYAYWREELPDADLPWGVFGENITTAGVLETDVSIGDRFQVGTAEFCVTQPRQPCFKLAIRFGREDMIRRFVESDRSGFYVSVVREGAIASGDAIHFIERAADSMSVAAIASLRYDDYDKQDELKRASELPGLSAGWRDHFRKRAEEA